MAIYKRDRGFELGATEKQIQVVVRVGLEPGTAGLRVRHADHSATLPPLVLYYSIFVVIHSTYFSLYIILPLIIMPLQECENLCS